MMNIKRNISITWTKWAYSDLSRGRMPGKRKDKPRISVVFGTNYNGTDRMHMIYWKSKEEIQKISIYMLWTYNCGKIQRFVWQVSWVRLKRILQIERWQESTFTDGWLQSPYYMSWINFLATKYSNSLVIKVLYKSISTSWPNKPSTARFLSMQCVSSWKR